MVDRMLSWLRLWPRPLRWGVPAVLMITLLAGAVWGAMPAKRTTPEVRQSPEPKAADAGLSEVALRLETAAPVAASSRPPVQHSAKLQVSVPVLMYHVMAAGPNNLYVAPEEFDAQLTWLTQQGYHAVTLQQLFDHFADDAPIPERPVVITFDDGYDNFYTAALPLLAKHKMVATLFVITGKVGQPGYITWEQTKAIAQAGMEIGSHTITHPDLRNVEAKGLQSELGDSQRILEERLGIPVRFFAYPGGRYSDQTLAAMSRYYRGAVTTISGVATPCQDRLLLHRIRVGQHLGGESLGRLIKYWEEQTKPELCKPARRVRAIQEYGPLP